MLNSAKALRYWWYGPDLKKNRLSMDWTHTEIEPDGKKYFRGKMIRKSGDEKETVYLTARITEFSDDTKHMTGVIAYDLRDTIKVDMTYVDGETVQAILNGLVQLALSDAGIIVTSDFPSHYRANESNQLF